MVKEKSTILEIILMRITEMNDKELNELREIINKEYDKRQEERRRAARIAAKLKNMVGDDEKVAREREGRAATA